MGRGKRKAGRRRAVNLNHLLKALTKGRAVPPDGGIMVVAHQIIINGGVIRNEGKGR